MGLLGTARSMQRDLEKIADRADTDSPTGLHYVLQGADTCALLCLLSAMFSQHFSERSAPAQSRQACTQRIMQCAQGLLAMYVCRIAAQPF